MGLEAYLFQIKLNKPVNETEIEDLLIQVGMTCLPTSTRNKSLTDYRSYYFELRTKKGLTEAHSIYAPTHESTDIINMRFSVLSPRSVIEQTFNLLSNLNSIIPIKVYDTEIHNHIYRQLRKEGIVDQEFEGIENTDKEKEIHQRCFIPIDEDSFSKNELSVYKRELILNNDRGEIIESGSKTTKLIGKKGVAERFINWIKKEL